MPWRLHDSISSRALYWPGKRCFKHIFFLSTQQQTSQFFGGQVLAALWMLRPEIALVMHAAAAHPNPPFIHPEELN